MKIYRLKKEQYLPVLIDEAWDFFSSPANLNVMTPDDLEFEILTDLKDEKMYSGMIINYKVSPFAGIKMRWTTEITHVENKRYFVDAQRFGPYAFWHHKHFFERAENGVKVIDVVDYGLPMGFLGKVIHGIAVKGQLQKIFDYREEKLKELFGHYPDKNG